MNDGLSPIIDTIDQFISEIRTIDSKSDGSRYPIDKHADVIHDKNAHLDVVNLHDKMAQLFEMKDVLAVQIRK